jgi:hypothetical protein
MNASPAPQGYLTPLVEEVTRLLQREGTVRVDELHVAAVLESRGISDQTAADEFGHDDVFALASVVADHLPPSGLPERQDMGVGSELPDRSRTLAHGPLYLMPSVVYPTVLAVLGSTAMFCGLVSSTALGWIWGMGMSAVAYQLRGQGRDRAAGQALGLLSAVGVLLGLGAGTCLLAAGVAGPELTAFVTLQVAFMLASGVLIFYTREAVLAVMAAPAVVAGIVHITSGFSPALTKPTLFLAAISVVLLMGAAWQVAGQAARGVGESDRSPGVAGTGPVRLMAVLRGCVPSVVYACLCAWFLLFTDARYFRSAPDLSAAAAPLILGMGVVEWRVYHFIQDSRELIDSWWSPRNFQQEIWRLMIRELGMCVLALSGLSLGFLVLVGRHQDVSREGIVLVDAHVLVGCAFFLAFVLSWKKRFTTVLGILFVVALGNVVLVTVGFFHWPPVGAAEAFLWSAAALFVLLLAEFRNSLRHVYQHYC